MERLPALLGAVGVFLVGTWAGGLLKDPTLALVGGVAGMLIGGVSLALQTQWARRRFPRLAPKRSRLSRLHADVTTIRSELKRENARGSVDIGAWDPRLEKFVGKFWIQLALIEPDDWRVEKLKIVDYQLVSRKGSREPSIWAARMLAHLQILRSLVETRMNQYPLK